MKKISVVIPVYNEEQVISKCIERVKAVLDKLEDYNYEIILVNDGSRDKTSTIIEEMTKTDLRH